MQREEYEVIMTAWADEACELADGFRSLFPGTTEGYMKFIFTLHYMAAAESIKRGIPDSGIVQAAPTILAHWFKAGKPENVEFLCVDRELMDEVVRRIRAAEEGGGGKPSSDA